MPVRPSNARDLFAAELRYPATTADVRDAVGDTELLAAGGESVSVATVLERSEETL